MSIVIDNKILIVLFRIFFFNTNYLLVKLFQLISFSLKESIHIKLSAKRQCAVMGAGEDALGEVFCSSAPLFSLSFPFGSIPHGFGARGKNMLRRQTV